MHILAIDIGSYSVKYISSFVDKRKVTHVDMSEIIVHDFLNDHSEMTIQEGQASIVQEVIDNVARADTKIIYQVDHEIMTTRFLNLPVKNKKKASLMLPFQLEEDIPFSLSEIHYAYRLETQKTQHSAMIELVRNDVFEDFYNIYRNKNILPNILTTESSVLENYFNITPIAGPFCVLDIGHKFSKAYFFYNSRLMMTHTSYTGGKHINDMIAETYKIESDEAIFYKHQNAFFLTSSQYEEVDESQKDFATAMDKVLAPLVSDFSRWKVGFKVNFGLSIHQVFICGGTSNIKNISNYLTEKWDLKVSHLESFDQVEAEKVDLNQKSKAKFALANMMASGFKKKNRFINLLSGKFAQASSSEIPLHSIAFLGVRVAAVAIVFIASLFAERFFLEKDISTVNSKINVLIRNDELLVPGRLRRMVVQNPAPVYDMLLKRQRGVRQEISTLQSAIGIQALTPLVKVSQIASNSQATMIEFKSDDFGEISATFSAESTGELTKLKETFERSNLADVSATIDQGKKNLQVKALGN